MKYLTCEESNGVDMQRRRDVVDIIAIDRQVCIKLFRKILSRAIFTRLDIKVIFPTFQRILKSYIILFNQEHCIILLRLEKRNDFNVKLKIGIIYKLLLQYICQNIIYYFPSKREEHYIFFFISLHFLSRYDSQLGCVTLLAYFNFVIGVYTS